MSALNIQMEIVESDFQATMGGISLKIWGISLLDISESSDFTGRTINIYGGMQKGLPLANSNQNGLLFSGSIYQAWGNWEGINMTLDFTIIPHFGHDVPLNISFTCKTGQLLTDALQQALLPAYPPPFKVNTSNTSQTLTANQDYHAVYGNLIQFALDINNLSKFFITDPTYGGLRVILRPNEVFVYDTTMAQENITQIKSEDLIGQPTWIALNTIQFKTVMRADIKSPDWVRLPPGQITLGPKSYSAFKENVTFNSVSKPFQVRRIRHVGDYRNPDPAAWVSIFDCDVING